MTYNILLVDDDDVAAEFILRQVKKEQFNLAITTAEDGLEALNILKGLDTTKTIQQPLIVLLDLNMPRMNGFEFLNIIRSDEQLKSIIVFVLTTSDADSDREKAYDKNIAGYLIKDKLGSKFSALFKLLHDYAEIVSLPNNILH